MLCKNFHVDIYLIPCTNQKQNLRKTELNNINETIMVFGILIQHEKQTYIQRTNRTLLLFEHT